jgi:glycosyltransferase involved in cell wall biosynthesis
MNILMFNTYNPKLASGIVALDLFNLLVAKGHNVKLLVNRYDQKYPEGVVSIETRIKSIKRTILYKFQWRIDILRSWLNLDKREHPDPDYRFFQLKEQKLIYKTDRLIKKAALKPDVIIVLFVKKFINARNIYELYEKTNAKVYWLMFDMGPLTGGCHYAWKCKGYQNNCGNCPALFSSDSMDLSHENLLYKRNYLDKTKIEILAASEWQYDQAKRSSLFKNNTIHKILLSVNPAIFKPVDKHEIRLKLKIPSDVKILFFGSVGLTEKRKGMFYLIESLKVLKQKTENAGLPFSNKIVLLAAGRQFEQIVDLLPFEYHNMGMVNNTYGIASAYQAADIYVCPSIEDSGPMMINQSMMCGTPVVSFEMGVALDLVNTGETGYRARLKDINDMADGILNILTLDKTNYKIMSDKCRDLALKLCSPEVQIEKIDNILINRYE